MSETLDYDSLAAKLAEVEAERDGWIETARMHHDAEAAFLKWLREAGEHMRAEGVTVCDDGVDSGGILAAKVPACAALLKARADAAEAKLAEADAMIEAQQKDYASNNVRFAEAEHRAKAAEARIAHLENHIEAVAKDTHKIMVAAEAALPAVYRLGLEAAASRFDEIAQHDQGGIDYSNLVGIPISNREQLVKSVKDAEMDANSIRALPTPTAAELMARINEGEKE